MLPLVFFFVALFYSAVGFGGGSSYLAALALSEVPFHLVPKIALICNLLVVTSGLCIYYRQKLLNKNLILPFVISSVPMAFLGGLYPIKEKTFILLLAVSLLSSGLRLFFITDSAKDHENLPSKTIALSIGAFIGFLSGLVGLGGGIFLSPMLMNFKWGKPKEIASTASAFIFLNSIAGLIGQFYKVPSTDIFNFWPLFASVIIGGQIGPRIGSSKKVSENLFRKATGLMILLICLKIFFNIF